MEEDPDSDNESLAKPAKTFIIPKRPHIGDPSNRWAKDSLFDSTHGDISLAWRLGAFSRPEVRPASICFQGYASFLIAHVRFYGSCLTSTTLICASTSPPDFHLHFISRDPRTHQSLNLLIPLQVPHPSELAYQTGGIFIQIM